MRTIHLPILRSRKGVGVVYLFGLQSLRMVALASIQLRAKEENAREITVDFASRSLQGNLTRIDNSNSR